jgi:hypothetical protein
VAVAVADAAVLLVCDEVGLLEVVEEEEEDWARFEVT